MFSVPDSINSFIFSKGVNNQIKLITPFGSHTLKDSVFIYEKFKSLDFSKQINDVGRPLNNNEYRSIVLNEKLHLFHNGGGVVFEEFEGSFRRVDNSTLHLNQASGFYFEIDNRLHLYGGYGLWTHKEYINFFMILRSSSGISITTTVAMFQLPDGKLSEIMQVTSFMFWAAGLEIQILI